MLQAILIGNLGANAQKQEQNGKKFTTFRVAHNDSWTDDAGQVHTETKWIDCIINDHPKVADYLLAGTNVFVQGSITTRVYSSAKDRCMKAGITVRVRTIELLGGKRDEVPSRLYDAQGVQHDVRKFYHTDVVNASLMTPQGAQFLTDDNGWVTPAPSEQTDNANQTEHANEPNNSDSH